MEQTTTALSCRGLSKKTPKKTQKQRQADG